MKFKKLFSQILIIIAFCVFQTSILLAQCTPDVMPPVLSGIPSTVTVTSCTLPTSVPSVVDDCTNPIAPNFTDVNSTSTCGGGTIVRTWKATDAAGNTGFLTQIISVSADNISPAIVAGQDLVLDCDPATTPALVAAWLANHGGATATDCNAITWTNTPVSPILASGCSGNAVVVNVTFSAQDACGNVSTTVAKINITDTHAPIVTKAAQNKVVACTDAASELDIWLSNGGGSTASDMCAGASLIIKYQINGVFYTKTQVLGFFVDSLNLGCQDNVMVGGNIVNNVVGKMKVSFIYSDPCMNNAAPTIASFVATDNQAPNFATPAANKTVECDNVNIQTELSVWYNNFAGGVGLDECATTTSIRADQTLAQVQIALALSQVNNCGETGQVTVQFFVQDPCGNENPVASKATFTVRDIQAPIFVKLPANLTVNCAATPTNTTELQNFITSKAAATATENCSTPIVWTYNWTDKNNVSGANIFPIVPNPSVCDWYVDVTFTATDECNNKDSKMARFSIKDVTAPTFLVTPLNVTVDCAVIPVQGSDTPTFSDNCSTPTIILVETSNQTTACAGNYTIKRTWTVTDACTNSSVFTRTITITDNQTPVITGVPSNLTVNCDAVPPVPKVTVSDNCDAAPSLVSTETSTQGTDATLCTFYNYTLTRQWMATDKCANVTTKSYVVTVKDDMPPSFVVPANVTVECNDYNNSTITGRPTLLTDNCDTKAKLDSTDVISVGACVNTPIYTRTWKTTDVCGNTFTKNQTITTKDTKTPRLIGVPANVTLECGTAVPLAPSVVANDTCQASNFAATLTTNTLTNCSGFGTQQIQRTWTATDNCNNTTSKTQIITYIDTQKPIFLSCPSDVTYNATAGQCSSFVPLITPTILDNCNITQGNYAQTQNRTIASAIPGDFETKVNDVNITFTGVPINSITSASNVVFTIILNNIDGEQNTEYFDIIGENNTNLGKTNNSATQCGTSTTTVALTAAQVNSWGQDNNIQITLKPNVNVGAGNPLSYAINDICVPASTLVANLSFSTTRSEGVTAAYRIDNNPIQPVPLINIGQTLAVGNHTIKYYIKDCSNNVDSCQYQMLIKDVEVPNMTAPNNVTYNITSASPACNITQAIPTPTNISDNCGFGTGYVQKQPAIAGDSLLIFNYDANLLNYIAADKIFTFSGVTQNVITSNVTLTVKMKGDIEGAGEYYKFLGEDNMPLTTTSSNGTGNTEKSIACGAITTTTFTIPSTTFNTWAANGQITINAVANKSFPIATAGTYPGISPIDAACNNINLTANGQKDNVSWMTATLVYNTANPIYSTSGATVTPPTPLFQPSITPNVAFNIGVTTVKYELSDAYNNTKTVTYTVNVVDNVAPVAKCQNTVVFLNPSATGPATISPANIDAGSTDNCGIGSITVTPNTFTCADVNMNKSVALVVKDLSGNTSICAATVSIQPEKPKPTFSIGICGNDTLKLFANPPAANGGIVYNFDWSGPNGFVSNLQNPIIPNVTSANGGSYVVSLQSVFGGGNCGSVATLEIPIDNQPNTPIVNSPDPTPCTNGELILNTQPYTGNNVKYYWYKGIAPSGTLVDSTTVSSYSIFNPTVGLVKYYVVVKVDACTSNPSASISVSPQTPPTAVLTNSPIIEVCEGETVTLGTSTVGLGYTYQWSGPDGFSANTQYPPVFSQVSPSKSGTYSLIIAANGCESAAVATSVNIKPKPVTPQLAANGLDCEGSTINLLSSITSGVSSYHWIKPDFSEQVTTTNILPLNNLNKTTMKGTWKLYLKNNGCVSNQSNSIELKVNSKPVVVADYQNPVCEGSQLNLLGVAPTNSSFGWTGPNNFIASTQNPSTTALAGIYIVTAIDQNGCSNFDDVLVDPKPKPDITAISSNAQPCVTGTADIKLTPTVFPFNGVYQYQWNGINVVSNQEMLTLPNATASVNGTYTLVVTNQFGCVSLPKNYVIDVRNVPQTPVIKGLLAQNICIGDDLLLELDNTNTYIGANITYKWSTPAGIVTTSVPTLTIAAAQAVNSGIYSVKVTVDNCESASSGTKTITVNPIPSKPNALVNTPICEGETVFLNTPFITNAMYEWTGPGFTSAINNPTIPNAVKSNQGAYKVRVVLNACKSPFSDNVFLTVNELPKQVPTVKNNGPICLDTPNSSIMLSVDAATGIPGATYVWYNASTNTPISPSSSLLNYTITNLLPYQEGTQEFYVIATFNGCSAKPSVPTAVIFNKIPVSNAFAGADISVCNANSVDLAAQKPLTGTGVWSQVVGSSIVIADASLNTTKVNGLVANQNYVLQWKLSNGACKDYSFDEVKINVNDTSIKANAGDSIQVCAKTQINLNATVLPTGTTGVWTQSSAQQQLGIAIANPSNPQTLVTGLSAGNMYAFKWTISNTACIDYSNDDVFVTVNSPQGTALAGVDFKACGNGGITLNAIPTAGAKGQWTSLNATALIVSPNQANSGIKNLSPGVNKFVWTISNSACPTYSRDTVSVFYEKIIIAVADNITVPYAGAFTFNPVANDLDIPSSGYTLVLSQQPKHGKVTIGADKKMTYKADAGYAGVDDYQYEICNSNCPDICATAKVNITIDGGNDCTIPTIITPNDDNINDAWEIPCLAGVNFLNNTVVVFNQWGDEVFRANNYSNDWKGTYNSQPLPAATYFYVINFGTGQPKNGFLIIER